MDQDQRSRIENALLRYRRTVLDHNLSLLRILVEEVEAQPAPTGYRDSAEQFLRVEAIKEHVVVPDSVKLTSEILDERFRDALISEGCLDGVSHGPVDLAGRREYFASIQASIARKGVEVAEFPPRRFAVPLFPCPRRHWSGASVPPRSIPVPLRYTP
ncbi:hypothetical protein FVER14953_09858 [Fusarium verticillioides]|nr:hypothetical protein FVER14953_09858 [Fusarium verticillioides]